MRCDITGKPDSFGQYEIIDGKLRPRGLKDGEHVGFDVTLMDSASKTHTFRDAKSEPGSIDEAVRRALAAEAESKQMDVQSMIASMTAHDFEKLIAKIVSGHIRAKTGEAMLGDAALNIAECTYAFVRARTKHRLSGRPFTAEDAAAAVADVAGNKSATAYQNDGAYAAELDRLRSEADGARIARKHVTANAWRR